jgi:cytochrome oxidase Cu insertion factor (SCO1/SenC/PrrC family)
MRGMNARLEADNPTIVSAFHRELLRQGLLILVIVTTAAVIYGVLQLLRHERAPADSPAEVRVAPEPAARRFLRISFGALWLFDGLLQGQSSMPLGMVPQVIDPADASSPAWVRHLDGTTATVWGNHPVTVAAAAVWIQVGIGIWLLAAPRGNWSRLAGLASLLWGLNVWVFGEAFGGIFAPGLSWLFGAPGAAVFYCCAGGLIALRESAWRTARLGHVVLRATGVFLLGMALLQAWPGRGFWQGEVRAGPGSGALTAMIREMSLTPQPHILSSTLSSFGELVAEHGWQVNLLIVIALAAVGVAFLTARPCVLRIAAAAGTVLCLAVWVLVQDLGFLGGVGTDPNSMIPTALIFLCGYIAITRVGVEAPAADAAPGAQGPWLDRISPSYLYRSLAALAAVAITLVGAIPMGVAAAQPQADSIIAQALDGSPNEVSLPAEPFTLTDQADRRVSLASLRGKTIALTFLDDVCTSDCPIIAQEFRLADGILGRDARRVELVAVNANPLYVDPDYLAAFDRQEGMEGLPNWIYLTAPVGQLQRVWAAYGASVQFSRAGAMIAHSDSADVIDSAGRIRYVLDTDPGPGTAETKSSFAVTLADALKSVLHTT